MNEEAVFDHERFEHWDLLKVYYLLPWQAIKNGKTFISKAKEIEQALDIKPSYEGKEVIFSELLDLMQGMAKDLEQKMDAPGGKFLAQAISMDLPL